MTATEPPDAADGEVAESPPWLAVSRGVALFLGTFALLNLLQELRHTGPLADLSWLGIDACPTPVARGGLALAALLLILFAARPRMPVLLRRAAIAAVLLLVAVALWSALGFYAAARSGASPSAFCVPFSLHVAACLLVTLAGVRSGVETNRLEGRHFWLFAASFLFCAGTFPLTAVGFGTTGIPEADDIVVLCRGPAERGPHARETADCLRTASRLYHGGLSGRLILAGAADGFDAQLVESLQRLGVPAECIDIAASRFGTNVISKSRKSAEAGRILLVGDDSQLSSAAVDYRRAGIEAHAVPIERAATSFGVFGSLARRAAVLWAHAADASPRVR